MQGIAQEQMGDMTKWTDIVGFNNLRYPYIVDTVEEKMKDPDHLVTIGDTVLVKAGDDSQTNLIQELRRSTEYDQEELFALALGKDFDILPFPRKLGDPGRDVEELELKGDKRGDIATIRGLDNLLQSLYVRLITPRGSYVGHPNYGSYLYKYVGRKGTQDIAVMIDVEIERTIRTDTRVTQCNLVNRSISGNTYQAVFSVSTLDIEDAFNMVIQAQEDGTILLLDDNFNDLNV
jgi:phage baseplate assembly protein W